MAANRGSHPQHAVVETGHINIDVSFFFLFFAGGFMPIDTPLFWFEFQMIFWQGKSYQCEVCCWWNGAVEIMEMVEVEYKNG
jgi:hypothetical protein